MDDFAPLTPDEIEAASAVALQSKTDDGITLVSPIPPDAPAPWSSHLQHGTPTARWAYRDADGDVLFHVFRFDTAGGGKEILPQTLWRFNDGTLAWRWKSVTAPRPLLNLDRLAANPTASVVIVEGEKSADAAERIFPPCVVTTSPNGSQSAAKADWTPLAGRRVLIWGDADEAGAKYAREVAEILDELGCDVGVVDGQAIAKLAPDGAARECPMAGWDAVDAVQEWADLAKLRKAVGGLRKPFERGPLFVSHGDFRMTPKGLYVDLPPSPKTGESGQAWVCGSFEIIGEARDPSGRGWAKVLRWSDSDKREHTAHIPVAAIHGEPATLAALLGADGLRIDRSQHKSLANYLNGASVKRRVTTVGRTGWHTIGGHDVFVLPQETIGPCGAESVILDGAPAGPYETRGLLGDWQRSVAEPAGEHALGVLALSASVAGSLLHLAGQEGGGINFWGPSSLGKSTLLKIAASVWGRGGSPGFVRAWRATSNGLEGAAASSSDTLLVLDELGVVEAREAASAIYGLANGSGKARASRNGDLREPKTWRVFTLSSGELPIEMKLNEDRGRRAMAGQLVRLLDIPVDRGMGFGAFDNGGPDADAAAVSKMLTAAAIDNYGTAGPEYVRRLITEGVTGDFVRTLVADVVGSLTPPRPDGQVDRAAQRLALVAAAGEIGIEMGVLPWKSGAPKASVKWALDRWLEGRGGTESREEKQAVETVRLVIEQFGESRFESLDRETPRVLNRLGWTTGDGAERLWLIPPEIWRSEICAGLDPKFVAATLGRRRMLLHGGDGWQSVKRIEGSAKRVFAITVAIFEGATDDGA